MKKEIKTELTRERIMEAAMDEFGSKGYSGASLNNICDRGISKGLLYHNFKNKDQLYLACIDRCFKCLTDFLMEKNTGMSIRKYMDARLQFFNEHDKEARLFFETILQPPKKLNEQIQELRQDFDMFNKRMYEKMISEIKLRDGVSTKDAMEYFSLMQNMFNGYFSSPVFCEMTFSDVVAVHEQSLSRMLDFMIYGIAERGENK